MLTERTRKIEHFSEKTKKIDELKIKQNIYDIKKIILHQKNKNDLNKMI